MGNYKGISLLCGVQNIWVEVVRNRLEKEIEEKGMIPESQAGKGDLGRTDQR